jgi:hypothetical protein
LRFCSSETTQEDVPILTHPHSHSSKAHGQLKSFQHRHSREGFAVLHHRHGVAYEEPVRGALPGTVRWECEKTYCGKYTLEKTYDLVGKNDYTSTITFRPNSQSIKQNGNTLTIVFLYTQQERVNLVHNIKTAQFSHLLKNSLRSLAV